MLLRAFGVGLLLVCIPPAFAQPVQGGDLRAGTVSPKGTTTLTAGSVTVDGNLLGLAAGTITEGRIIAGTATGRVDNRTFTGQITGATIESAKITGVKINQRDASGKMTQVPSADLPNVRLEKATLSQAVIDDSQIVLGGSQSQPAKNVSYESDYVVLGVEVPEFNVKGDLQKRVTARAGAKFKIGKETEHDGAKYLSAQFRKDCLLPYRVKLPWLSDPLFPNASKCDESAVQHNCARGTVVGSDGELCDNVPYEIRKDVLNAYEHDRFGITYGMMVVPFKAYLGNNRTITTGATIGPYLGYGAISPGTWNVLAVSAGIASIPVQHQQNGTTTTTSETALSIAFGYIGTFKDSFNMGLFLGWDLLNKPSDYKYNGKPWVGIHLGYDLR